MKLTRRQEEFIENLIDLSHELDGPIHYSTLAERLGVSPFTAYDMLRLLEDKGMVTSEYQVAAGKTGPGRAERLFYPVNQKEVREHRLTEKFGSMALNQEELKQFLLNKARQGEFPKKGLAEELLARIPPDGPAPIQYCQEVMMVIAFHLRQHNGPQRFSAHLSDILPVDGVVSPANLCLLGGFAYGMLAQEESKDREWSQMLLEHVLQYQEIVRRMEPADCKLLADGLASIFAPLEKNSSVAK